MKFIILAAGAGKRLRNVCNDKPKPLFEIGKKSLLEHSLDALSKIGATSATIVIGYKGHMIRDKIGMNYKKIKIRYAKNEAYDTTDSMHSVYSAFKDDKSEDCVVLDSDIIYNPSIIRSLIKYEKKDVAFLTKCCGSGDETFTVLDASGKIIYLRLKKSENLDFLKGKKVFEFNGIAKFSKEFLRRMLKLYKRKIKSDERSCYYEGCAIEVSKEIPWYGMVNENFVLAEVDRKKDIARAEELLKKISL